MSAERPRCTVCKAENKVAVHALLASGMSYHAIADETRKRGIPIKRETIGKHVAVCLRGARPVLDEVTAQNIADMTNGDLSPNERDFATLVQRRATQLLASGDLRVTATHGLQAQALLDRRAEKQADRDLALNMARLLSGAIFMPPITVIESRAVEVTDGLAPEGVFEPVDA